ncbi:MAG: hypothetical protein IKZ60_05055 [Bacteroidales bacterium]|nr:hypothetical protein [Bacteroidales bacterium]
MKYRYLICLALAVAAIACTKQPKEQLIDMPEFGPNPVPSPEDGYSYLTLSIPASEDLLWKDGDRICVEGSAGTETYTLVPGSSAVKGTFRGNAVTGTSFNIIVPGPQDSFAAVDGKDYSQQTQAANADDTHIVTLYALNGVNTLEGATLSTEWASANGGKFLKTGRMTMDIQVPSAITKVSSLQVSSSVAAFGTYTLTLPELKMADTGHYIKAFLNLPWSIPAPAAGDVITITLNGDKTATKSTTLADENTGAAVSVSLNGKEWTGEGLVMAGEGTSESPYLVNSSDDLFNMKDVLVENAQSPVYFLLTANIDMKEMAWTPLVTEEKVFPIDFDGGGHTISNLTVGGDAAFPSFAGVVTGSIHDVTFENAVITGSASGGTGIVAGQGSKVTLKNCHATGTISSAVTLTGGIIGCIALGDDGSVIENCSFKGSIDLPAAGDYNGGIVGALRKGAKNILISGCSVEADITSGTSKGYIGGILGANWNGNSNVTIEKCSYKGTIKTAASGNGGSGLAGICGYTQAITIRNCRSEGTITQCNYGIGGIAGTVFQDCTIENCFSSMTLYSRHGTGGIAGRADNNANASDATTGYNDKFIKCIAWNTSIGSRLGIGASNLSDGAIVGKCVSKNIHQGCVRRPDMLFDCYTDAQYNTLFDQADNDASGAMQIPTSLGQYYWPYHGTAAAAGKTASDVARDLGWDTSIWDLSGSTPVLK